MPENLLTDYHRHSRKAPAMLPVDIFVSDSGRTFEVHSHDCGCAPDDRDTVADGLGIVGISDLSECISAHGGCLEDAFFAACLPNHPALYLHPSEAMYEGETS